MHLLPAIDCGDRWVRLPLSDAAAMQLADLWMTDDAQQRRPMLSHLIVHQPTLALWTASQVASDTDPVDLAALVDWSDAHLIAAWRESDTESVPVQATEQQLREWAGLAAQSAQCHLLSQDFRGLAAQWLAASPTVRKSALADQGYDIAWTERLAEEPESTAPLALDDSELASRLRAEWLGSSRSFSNLLYRTADKLRQLRRLETRFAAAVEEEKLAALKEFAYGASHEINNPLANISTRAQTLLRDERDPERRRKLATINSQAFRAHEMISDLMLFARPPMIEPQPLNIPALIDRLVAELTEMASAQGTVLIHRSPDHDLTTLADETHLLVALKAICMNGLEALAMGGRLTLWSKRSEQLALGPDVPGPWIEIGIHDSGPGITSEVRRHIFDPYFSGREAGRGLGLGLSKSWRIVNLHGGQIEVNSDEHGTTFLVLLPMQRGVRRSPPAAAYSTTASQVAR